MCPVRTPDSCSTLRVTHVCIASRLRLSSQDTHLPWCANFRIDNSTMADFSPRFHMILAFHSAHRPLSKFCARGDSLCETSPVIARSWLKSSESKSNRLKLCLRLCGPSSHEGLAADSGAAMLMYVGLSRLQASGFLVTENHIKNSGRVHTCNFLAICGRDTFFFRRPYLKTSADRERKLLMILGPRTKTERKTARWVEMMIAVKTSTI